MGKNIQIKGDARVRNSRRRLVGSSLGIFPSQSSMERISSTITGPGSQALKPETLLPVSPSRKVKTGFEHLNILGQSNIQPIIREREMGSSLSLLT